MPSPAYSCVLWDVDGTVVDGSVSILRRIGRVLDDFGITGPTAGEAPEWLGPPLAEAFRDRAGLPDALVPAAVARFNGISAEEGPEAVVVYPGIVEILKDLRAARVLQATASAKHQSPLEAIFDRYGLVDLVDEICGASDDPSTVETKADVIARALDALDRRGADLSRPVLIGDRHHDVEGGRRNGLPVIFAEWGFGSPDEADGALARASSPDHLRRLLWAGA